MIKDPGSNYSCFADIVRSREWGSPPKQSITGSPGLWAALHCCSHKTSVNVSLRSKTQEPSKEYGHLSFNLKTKSQFQLPSGRVGGLASDASVCFLMQMSAFPAPQIRNYRFELYSPSPMTQMTQGQHFWRFGLNVTTASSF